MDAFRELAFEKKDFDAFLVCNEKNLLYLTGTPGALLLADSEERRKHCLRVRCELRTDEGGSKRFQG